MSSTNHTCACVYGPNGVCIWCHSSEPLGAGKIPHRKPEPPVASLGNRAPRRSGIYQKQFAADRPLSHWARSNMVRSAADLTGKPLLDRLEAEEEAYRELKLRVEKLLAQSRSLYPAASR